MAFPIPSHLPRKKDPQDVATRILTKISEADTKALSVELASSWLAELDDSIIQTKTRIHERIHDDLPAFDAQFKAAQSIQERLRALSLNVDELSDSLSNPESGLVPTLLASLNKHATLAREVADADVHHRALSHLRQCRDDFRALTELVQNGKLPEAVVACADFEKVLTACPTPLNDSVVVADLKRNFAALRARAEEQLNDAYARGIVLSPNELLIRPQIQVRQSETVIPLPSILSSLSPSSLSSQLTTLRRDITIYYIEHLLKQPAMVIAGFAKDISGAFEYKLSLIPSPPSSGDVASRLENLATVLTFLNEHLFPHLPPPENASFANSLSKPLRAAVLAHALVPSLPSSIDHLPAFLQLTDKAVDFEAEFVAQILGGSNREREIKVWADSAGMHYEKKRRVEILERARCVVLAPHDESKTFLVEIDIRTEQDQHSASTSVSEPAKKQQNGANHEKSEASWGFDDESPQEESAPIDENGWGFDDDAEPGAESEPELKPDVPSVPPPVVPGSNGEDPGDAWGWNDDDAPLDVDAEVEEDDPWGDAWDKKPKPAPKPAKNLEKFTAKGKSPSASRVVSPMQSPAVAVPTPAGSRATPKVPSAPITPARPLVLKESYLASGRTKEMIRLVESILLEGAELAASKILEAYLPSGVQSGTLIMHTAPLALEVYRALYPVSNAAHLAASAKRCMLYANDCLYLSSELNRVLEEFCGNINPAREKLVESAERLKILGESWFEDTLERQNQLICEVLNAAEGFVDTTEQDRFDDCESAVSKALQRTRQLSQQWRPVLNKSKYYAAIGSAVDAVLSRILADILALPDITAVESHRLSELCRIMNASEGLFAAEDPDQPSFVVSYVPSWLKFSYLGELLEASIADISYLFEAGALVDFEIDELVKLVRALFADTPLRTRTIEKLLQGHPVAS